jgi:transposase InsO family protein
MKPTRTVNSDGTIEYKLPDGQLHRDDGPAYEAPDGSKAWWINGLRHRDDGPAVEWPNGSKEWFLNGLRHRENGHAIEDPKGYKAWYLNDKQLTQQKFLKIIRNNKLNLI